MLRATERPHPLHTTAGRPGDHVIVPIGISKIGLDSQMDPACIRYQKRSMDVKAVDMLLATSPTNW